MKRYLIFALLLTLLPAGIAAGQATSNNFTLHRFTAVGGGSADSDSYRLTSVVGQGSTGLARSRNYRILGGFLFPLPEIIPTAVELSESGSESLTPFWLLVGSAGALLLATGYLRRKQVEQT